MDRYETYKPSGTDWAGDIPSEWKVKKLKFSTQINSTVLPEKTDEDFAFQYIDIGSVNSDGKLSYGEEVVFGDAPSRARRVVKNGDIIISTVRTYLKAIAYIPEDAEGSVCSTGFAVLTPLKDFFRPKFLFYLCRSEGFVEEICSLSEGVSYPAIDSDNLRNISALIPSLPEQEAIATYLDRKTAEIDPLIANKQTLIKLLKEERTAIINTAVTKGISSAPKLKPSGVDWLGDIPEHWQWKSLRYVGQCQNGVSAGADYFGFGFPFVSYGDVYKNSALPVNVLGLANSSESDRENYSVKEGDVFFTRTSETIEEIGISSTCLETIENAVFAGFLIRFRPFEKLLHPRFSKYYFRAEIHRQFFVKEMNLVTRASLSQDLLKKMPILLPSLEEQNEIGMFLDDKTQGIERTISQIEKEIELMREYRTALTSEVVTGKIRVK
jgi:type I restriction enzyme, S subunit